MMHPTRVECPRCNHGYKIPSWLQSEAQDGNENGEDNVECSGCHKNFSYNIEIEITYNVVAEAYTSLTDADKKYLSWKEQNKATA